MGLIVLLAHSFFSIGIWNARDGYQEETACVSAAFHVLQTHRLNPSLYIDLIALVLRFFTNDPIVAVTIMKYIASLLATMGLYLILGCFTSILSEASILFACFLWIASYFDAPIAQSTSLALFAFGIVLPGLYYALKSESALGLLVFSIFDVIAALIRPEYFLTLLLVGLLFGGRLARKNNERIRTRQGLPPLITWGAATVAIAILCAIVFVRPPAAIKNKLAALDDYALFGFSQCYAGYYHGKHPEISFSPMTEYQTIIDAEFHNPKTFADLLRNNPGAAIGYLAENGAKNLLLNLPKALLGRYREQPATNLHGWLYWSVRAFLLAGFVASIIRLRKTSCDPAPPTNSRKAASTTHKLFLLLALAATSCAAILMLIPTPRYYLQWIPLFYLGVAFCFDSLLIALTAAHLEKPILAFSCLILCWPNFVGPRPNSVIDAVRQAAPLVQSPPRIAAWWPDPYRVEGLCNQVSTLSLQSEIHASDITNGNVNILLIDPSFRSTSSWAHDRSFFEKFERVPEQFGFKKVNEPRTGEFTVYYKPARRL